MGRQTSSTPTLIIASLPRISPARTPTTPAARKDAPRTVNQASTDRIGASFWPPCQSTYRNRPGLPAGERDPLDDLGKHLLRVLAPDDGLRGGRRRARAPGA